MTYSAVADLLLGNVPLPTTLDPAKFVQDAADEIDSRIGFVYVTPIPVASMSAPSERPTALLLKRISNWLASGRLILALDAGGEDYAVHAYGLKLVKDASEAIDAICSLQVILEGAMRLDGTEPLTGHKARPLIHNLDPQSQVEAFYAYTADPLAYRPYGENGGPYRTENGSGMW
jgi:hypothetical protein